MVQGLQEPGGQAVWAPMQMEKKIWIPPQKESGKGETGLRHRPHASRPHNASPFMHLACPASISLPPRLYLFLDTITCTNTSSSLSLHIVSIWVPRR